ncbi:MAG: glycosyltransferase [Solirubrobacteraceae bacterium]
MASEPVVVFFPEGAYGPTNNCVGIADALRRRGGRPVFVVEESFAGTLEAQGFEERLMRLGPAPEVEEAPGQFWKDFIRDTAPVFRRSTLEQLEGFIAPTWKALLDGARYVEPRLREIFGELRPDAIVEDNVPGFAAVVNADAPWVRIVSCNPLEMHDPELPPVFSGYPVADRSGWEEFRAEYRRTHEPMWREFDEWMGEQGCPPLPEMAFIHESPDLNLFLYPEEADYPRSRPLGAGWTRLDSCVRATDAAYEIPAEIAEGEGRLVYLSLGSLGSADTELMQRLLDLLGSTPHRYVVSMGPQHDLLRLAPNQAGAEQVPQTSVLPQVDLVITHGGNNTVTECFHFGRPMLVLPIFWDQHDNATRVAEAGFGERLDTYGFEDSELASAVDRLLGDEALAARLATISARLRANPGTERAAEAILRVAVRS